MVWNRSVLLLTASVAIVGSNSLVLSPISGAVATSFEGADAAGVMMASAYYGLGTAGSALVMAPKADQIGAIKALILALGVLVCSLVISTLAPTLSIFCLAQGVAGLAAGTALPATYSLSAQFAPKGRESEVLGIVLTGWTLSMVAGVSMSAILAEVIHWRGVYGALAVIGAGILMIMLATLTQTKETTRGMASSPISALKVKGILSALMMCAAYMIAFYGYYTFLGAHLSTVLGRSTAMAGLATLGYGLGFGAAVPLDKLIDRYGPKKMSIYVFLLLLMVYSVLAVLSSYFWGTIATCFVWGLVNHLGLNLIVGRLTGLDATQRGAILGLYSAVTYICVFISAVVYRPIFEQFGLFVCAILSALCMLPAIWDSLRYVNWYSRS